MVITDINFICGCGYRARNQVDAEAHVEKTKHQLGVSGAIKPTEKNVKTVKAQVRVQSTARTGKMKPLGNNPAQEEPINDFSTLRDRLRKNGK